MLRKQRGIRGFVEHRLAPRWFAGRYFRAGHERGLPLNGQAGREALIRHIITSCSIELIVETGTYMGATAEWFAGFRLPVHTVEISPLFAEFSRLRLRDKSNVVPVREYSIAFLRNLAKTMSDRRALFYLDAHWKKHLPLAGELMASLGHFRVSVAIVDDFAVPDDPGYGFDDYGVGKRLDIAYVRTSAPLPRVRVFYPALRSGEETGARRGSVVLTCNDELAPILASLPELRAG